MPRSPGLYDVIGTRRKCAAGLVEVVQVLVVGGQVLSSFSRVAIRPSLCETCSASESLRCVCRQEQEYLCSYVM